jgi:hypothetical protein
MERIWKINADGLVIKVTRYPDTMQLEFVREAPGVLLHSTSILILEQSKQLEAVFRAANRDDAEEGSKP